MKLKNYLTLGITLLMGASLASCGSTMNTLNDIKNKKQITLATNATFQPFEYLDNGTFKGIDIDFAKAYATSIGCELSVSDIDFDAIIPSIQTYKADIGIAGMTVTEARSKVVDFTESYYSASQVVIVKADSELAWLDTEELLKALEGKTIGCQIGTTGEAYITGSEDMGFEGIKNAKSKGYKDGVLATKDLAAGNIDAVIIDSAPASLYVKEYPTCVVVEDVVLTEEEYAIAVAKGNDTLLSSLNTFIKESKENGVLDSIISANYAE